MSLFGYTIQGILIDRLLHDVIFGILPKTHHPYFYGLHNPGRQAILAVEFVEATVLMNYQSTLMKWTRSLFLGCSLMFLFSCVKEPMDFIPNPPGNGPDTTVVIPVDSIPPIDTSSTRTCAPDYGRTILCEKYDKNDKKKKLVYPRNFPGLGKGKYVALPAGLVIDPQTGGIDVKKSESGLVYKVGYIAAGSRDTCFSKIIIGGITYIDGVHRLYHNDTLAVPIYNGDANSGPVCGPNALFANCEFDDDEDDDNGDGYLDEPPVGSGLNKMKIRVDKKTGVISLKRSILDGLFGIIPTSGRSVTGTMYYRLDDCSNKDLRKIDIKITYYNKLSQVPKTLLNTVTDAGQNILELLAGRTSYYSTNPRPPHIIVVAYP